MNNEQKKQGLVEWAKAFRANSWAEVNEIENTGVKEATKTMQFIMANPTEREMLRMRRDGEIDRRTEVNAARRQGKAEMAAEMARSMKREGVDPVFISKHSGLTLEEIRAL